MAEIQRLADLPKNGRERVRVAIAEFKGARYVDVRLFATSSDASLVPTPKGVSLRGDMLPLIIAALQEAERLLSKTSVVPTEGRR